MKYLLHGLGVLAMLSALTMLACAGTPAVNRDQPEAANPAAPPPAAEPEAADPPPLHYGLLTTVGGATAGTTSSATGGATAGSTAGAEEIFLDPLLVYPLAYPLADMDFPLILRRSARQAALRYVFFLADGEIHALELDGELSTVGLVPPYDFLRELPFEYAVPKSSLKNNVLYGVGENREAIALLSVAPYSGPEMLQAQSASNALLSTGFPRWLPVLGSRGYDVEVQSGGELLIQRQIFRNRLAYDDFETLYDNAGNYEYRLRPLLNSDSLWSEWVPFSTSGRVILADERPLDYYDFVPGIAANERIDQPVSDERFPVDVDVDDTDDSAPFAIRPGRLPAFFLYELSNEHASLLLNAGIGAGDLRIGDNDTLYHADIPVPVLAMGSMFYGIQLGLELSTNEAGSTIVSPLPAYADHPLTGITWFGALYLANRLSIELGLEPVYLLDRLHWDRSKKGVRLPSEMEWELYARSNAPPPNSSNSNYLRSFDPWEDPQYPHNRNGGPTAPVRWGSNQLLGNVWEWCWDWYDEEAYARYALLEFPSLADLLSDLSEEERQLVFDTDADREAPFFQRTVRGAAWNSQFEALRVSNRGQFYWDETSWSVGLRFVVDR